MQFLSFLSLVLLPITLAQDFSSGQKGKPFLFELKASLSRNAEILTNSKSAEFQKRLERWTDTGKQTPGAIIAIASESDIIETVRLKASASVSGL